MKIEDMNEGVRILIERIKTNPEEFEKGFDSKWYDIIRNVIERVEGRERGLVFLHDDEVNAIYDALKEMQRQKFTANVLRRLTDAEPEGDQMNLPYLTTFSGHEKMRIGSSGTVTFNTKETQFDLEKIKQVYRDYRRQKGLA